MEKIRYRVAIVEDHQFFADCFQIYLNTYDYVEVVGLYPNPQKFFKDIGTNVPDIIFMDINMSGMNGIDATKKVLEHYPEVRVVALTECDDEETIRKMYDAGAYGYVFKSNSTEGLAKVFNSINLNQKHFTPEVAMKYMGSAISNSNGNKDELQVDIVDESGEYSDREKAIIRDISLGMTDKEIALHLKSSTKAIEYDKRKIMTKMGVSKSTQIITQGFKLGILK